MMYQHTTKTKKTKKTLPNMKTKPSYLHIYLLQWKHSLPIFQSHIFCSFFSVHAYILEKCITS